MNIIVYRTYFRRAIQTNAAKIHDNNNEFMDTKMKELSKLFPIQQ